MAMVVEEGSFRIPMAEVALVVEVAKVVAEMEAEVTKVEAEITRTEVVFRTSWCLRHIRRDRELERHMRP